MFELIELAISWSARSQGSGAASSGYQNHRTIHFEVGGEIDNYSKSRPRHEDLRRSRQHMHSKDSLTFRAWLTQGGEVGKTCMVKESYLSTLLARGGA